MLDLNSLSLNLLFDELVRDGCLSRLVLAARDEDLGPGGLPGDITSRVMDDARAQASACPSGASAAVIMRSPEGVLAGVRCIPEVLRVFAPQCSLEVIMSDGALSRRGDQIAVVTGPMPQILQAERTLLNLLGRLSGVATRTRTFVDKIRGTRARLLDTRKTTPGLRHLEKYAVRCGGGHCHRIGLHDAVLIKDNHIAGVSDLDLPRVVAQASARARAFAQASFASSSSKSIASNSSAPVLDAGGCGVDVILLDNMTPPALAQAVELRDHSGLPIELEASGGVTLDSIRDIACTGVDRISVGGLTHQAVSIDVALDA